MRIARRIPTRYAHSFPKSQRAPSRKTRLPSRPRHQQQLPLRVGDNPPQRSPMSLHHASVTTAGAAGRSASTRAQPSAELAVRTALLRSRLGLDKPAVRGSVEETLNKLRADLGRLSDGDALQRYVHHQRRAENPSLSGGERSESLIIARILGSRLEAEGVDLIAAMVAVRAAEARATVAAQGAEVGAAAASRSPSALHRLGARADASARSFRLAATSPAAALVIAVGALAAGYATTTAWDQVAGMGSNSGSSGNHGIYHSHQESGGHGSPGGGNPSYPVTGGRWAPGDQYQHPVQWFDQAARTALQPR